MSEPLTIRALPKIARQASLPDPCLADPLRPETWRPLLAARDAESPTASLCRVGHA